MELRPNKKWIAAAGMLIFFLLLVRTAWISDDAKITYRCVLNLIHGFGPNFNIAERVQAYTHPLWFLILSLGTYLGANIFYFTLILSFGMSLGVAYLLLRGSIHRQGAWIWVFSLIFSKAFVDFSTSGLENPLFHVMLFFGFTLGFKFLETNQKKFAVWSLLLLQSTYLCRPDLILIGFPFSLFLLSKFPTNRDRLRIGFISILPILIWTAFSLIYYGFPFPNTAYAKLNNAVPKLSLITRGIEYLFDSLTRDPITLITILSSIVISMRSNKTFRMMGLGILMYLFYIVWIGGDFMTGRFFTAPLLVAVIVLSQFELNGKVAVGVFAMTVLTGALPLLKHIPDDHKPIEPFGIIDERAYWFDENGMISRSRAKFTQPEWKLGERQVSRTCGYLGKAGLMQGPGDHIIDLCALAEPLLARLPPKKLYDWRAGHFFRQMPTNYEAFIDTGDEGLLADQATLDYWRILKVMVRDPIFSIHRLKTVLRMNLGLIPKPNFQMYANEDVPSQLLSIKYFENRQVPSPDNQSIYRFIYSIQLRMEKPMTIRSIDTSLMSYSGCKMEFLKNGVSASTIPLTIREGKVNRFINKMPKPIPNVTDVKISCESTQKDPIPRAGIGHFYVNKS